MSEITIVATMVLIAMIFFSLVYFFILSKSSEVQKAEVESEGRNLAEMVLKVSKDPSPLLQYFTYLPLSNLSIENGLLEYEKQGYKYVAFLNANISDVKLENVASVCIVKKDNTISLLEKCPSCNDNSVCEPEECNSNCPDCYGPSKTCINDGYCNIAIGENCENSNDCKCNANEICCPQDPNANKLGCLQKSKGKEGEECYCDTECEDGLKCNPTASNFKQYSKACCPPGKSWNGSTCVVASYCSYPCTSDCISPEKWDWRNVNGINYLNPVRDEGSCGSCWAFSTVGTIEAVYNIENKCPSCNKDLSEQELVSCSFAGSCLGGELPSALLWVLQNGIVDENCLPYQSDGCCYEKKTKPSINENCLKIEENVWVCCAQKCWSGSRCSYPKTCDLCSNSLSRKFSVNKIGQLPPDPEDIKKAIVCKGPLAVGSENWGHGFVVIGYDDEKKVWIIRNSWGSSWGENGYGYIPYNHKYGDFIYYAYYVEGVRGP